MIVLHTRYFDAKEKKNITLVLPIFAIDNTTHIDYIVRPQSKLLLDIFLRNVLYSKIV